MPRPDTRADIRARQQVTARTIRSTAAIASYIDAMATCSVRGATISKADTALILDQLKRAGATPQMVAGAMFETGYRFTFSPGGSVDYQRLVRGYLPLLDQSVPQQSQMRARTSLDDQVVAVRIQDLKQQAGMASAMGNHVLAKLLIRIILSLVSSEANDIEADIAERREQEEELEREIEAEAGASNFEAAD